MSDKYPLNTNTWDLHRDVQPRAKSSLLRYGIGVVCMLAMIVCWIVYAEGGEKYKTEFLVGAIISTVAFVICVILGFKKDKPRADDNKEQPMRDVEM